MLSDFQKRDIFSLKTFASIENISYLCTVMIRGKGFKSFKPSAASAETIEANAGNVLPGVRTLRKIPPRVVPEYGESATDRHGIRCRR